MLGPRKRLRWTLKKKPYGEGSGQSNERKSNPSKNLEGSLT